MIINAFSQYLKNLKTDVPPVTILSLWLKERILKNPENNIDKVLQEEITFFKNKRGFFLILAKSDSGIKLLESLYEFALSYDNHKFSRWLHKIKPTDFIKKNK